jgi:hypothetical protein
MSSYANQVYPFEICNQNIRLMNRILRAN